MEKQAYLILKVYKELALLKVSEASEAATE